MECGSRFPAHKPFAPVSLAITSRKKWRGRCNHLDSVQNAALDAQNGEPALYPYGCSSAGGCVDRFHNTEVLESFFACGFEGGVASQGLGEGVHFCGHLVDGFNVLGFWAL